MKNLVKYMPFTAIIALSIFAQSNDYSMGSIRLHAIVCGVMLLVNLILAITLKIKDYFLYGISSVGLIGIAGLLFFKPLGEIYINHIITGLYLGLFISAFIPPIFKIKPFTFAYSAGSYPKAVTEGTQFLKINLIINYIWAALFLLAMVLTNITYSSSETWQTILAMCVPIVLQLAVGIPAAVKLPSLLVSKVKGSSLNFTSAKELLEAMPYGFNKNKAEGLDAVIQFKLTGEDAIDGYMIIKEQKCSFAEGIHQNPTTTINSDAKLWLSISNGEISGDKAYMNGEYTVEGDMGILSQFGSLFSPDDDKDEEKVTNTPTSTFEYKKFKPRQIKNVVVIDSGHRSEGISKTTYFTKKFCEGLQSAGAKVEYVRLKDKDIKPCIGCFTCWTKTPGECVHKDDMAELLIKCREADLIVYASPLFIFNVNGTLKTFLDRLVPNIKPYLVTGEAGCTMHPDRYPELGNQGFVVFSAAGFPEVESNYDGMHSMFKMLDWHSERSYMMGEFYITAAETLPHPIYTKRKELISDACFKAGVQIVKEGKINRTYMDAVAQPNMSISSFKRQANNFWESLDGKETYLKMMPKIK